MQIQALLAGEAGAVGERREGEAEVANIEVVKSQLSSGEKEARIYRRRY